MVIGVTGHQDLPASAVGIIREGILAQLEGATELLGVCSLAVGADQLFAQLVLDRGGELRIVVPCRGYEETFEPGHYREGFYRLLGEAATVEQLEYSEPSEEAFFAAGRRVADIADRLVAVWDGQPARGVGGTADVVHYAETKHKPVAVIWPAGVFR